MALILFFVWTTWRFSENFWQLAFQNREEKCFFEWKRLKWVEIISRVDGLSLKKKMLRLLVLFILFAGRDKEERERERERNVKGTPFKCSLVMASFPNFPRPILGFDVRAGLPPSPSPINIVSFWVSREPLVIFKNKKEKKNCFFFLWSFAVSRGKVEKGFDDYKGIVTTLRMFCSMKRKEGIQKICRPT